MATDERSRNLRAEGMRETAREIFLRALAHASIEYAFDQHIAYERGILRVREDLYDLTSFSKVFVVSIGKAAHTMVEALMKRLGAGVGVTGIVCGPQEPASQMFGFRYFTGGHPVPNAESVRAAETILRALLHLPENTLVIFMISGGGSALVEKPISGDITLADLIASYRVLVHSGAPIAEINAVRKHLSAVKGGRLACAAAPAHQLSILISDVPENALDSLASGPTMPDTSTVTQCFDIVETYKMLERFPASVRGIFERHELDETPKPLDAEFVHSRWWSVLSNDSAVQAARQRAAKSGFAVHIDNSCDDWDYRQAAEHLLAKLRELRAAGGAPVCLISGGEVTVSIEGTAGRGGRNQQFAACCAAKIAGENITVLSAGTDGIDGASDAAGAVADGTTLTRAREAGFRVDGALARFDTNPLFTAIGDSVVTGPTGTNVRDVRVLLAW